MLMITDNQRANKANVREARRVEDTTGGAREPPFGLSRERPRGARGPRDPPRASGHERGAPRGRRSLAREIRKNTAFRAQLSALLLLRFVLARELWRVDVECYPEVPGHKYLIWKVALLAGMRLLPCR